MPGSDRLPDSEPADVDVSASVRMRSLRFGTVPTTRVWFEGLPDEVHSLRSERENLPDEVEAGVTYEDVTVRWKARARVVADAYLDLADRADERARPESPDERPPT